MELKTPGYSKKNTWLVFRSVLENFKLVDLQIVRYVLHRTIQ